MQAATYPGQGRLQAAPAGSRLHHQVKVAKGLLITSAASSSVTPEASTQHGLRQRASLLAQVGRTWYTHAARQQQQQQLPAPTDAQELRRQMAAAGRSCMAVVLPFAATTLGGGWQVTDLYDALAKAIDIYLFLLTVRVLLTWFRNINWFSEPFRTLRSFTDPALNACRGLLPAIGGIDLSPMLLFFGLNFAARQLKIMALSG